MTMRRTLTLATLAGALVVAPRAPASAAPARDEAEYVRDVVGRAAAHVEAGRYERALAVLDAAERERPLPVFVYVRATIEERRGDCERAVALYLRFLELPVAEEDAADARRGVARCRGEPEPATDPSAAADPSEPAPAAAPRDAAVGDPAAASSAGPDAPPLRPWYADPLGTSLVATGTVGLAVGLGLVGGSRADARAAADATSLQAFDDRSRRAIALDRAGIGTIAIGSALLLGGVIRWAVVGTRPRRHAVAFTSSGLRIRF